MSDALALFRAELRAASTGGKGASPRLWGAELSYRQENLKPRIDQLAVLEPGQILVPGNFNPSNQVYEPAHPHREGIFTSIGRQSDDDGGSRTKPLWKQGFRTLRWAAADPNDDQLVYDLAFRPADAADTEDAAQAGEEPARLDTAIVDSILSQARDAGFTIEPAA